MVVARLGIDQMQKRRLRAGEMITMLIVGAVATVLALGFPMLVRAPEIFQSVPAQPQTSLVVSP